MSTPVGNASPTDGPEATAATDRPSPVPPGAGPGTAGAAAAGPAIRGARMDAATAAATLAEAAAGPVRRPPLPVWFLYCYGAALGAPYRSWLVRDLTGPGWRLRQALRCAVQGLPFAIVFAILPGKSSLRVGLPVFIVVVGALLGLLLSGHLRNRRLIAHGLPPVMRPEEDEDDDWDDEPWEDEATLGEGQDPDEAGPDEAGPGGSGPGGSGPTDGAAIEGAAIEGAATDRAANDGTPGIAPPREADARNGEWDDDWDDDDWDDEVPPAPARRSRR